MKKFLFLVVFFSIVVGVGITTGWFADHPTLVVGLAVAGVFLVLLVGLIAGSIYSAYLIRLVGIPVAECQQDAGWMVTLYACRRRRLARSGHADQISVGCHL